MMMETIIQLFIVLPLLGFLASLLVSPKNEKQISAIVFFTVGIFVISYHLFLVYWIIDGAYIINVKEFVLFKTPHYEFYIDFFFDKIGAVYVSVGSMLTGLVTVYSRYYLHREAGYKRYFNTILFFFTGYNIVVFSGNFETMFVGWEILGISSFLLIAFYRDRYLPVKNALKVFSVYRIGDIGLILTMWASHHLWHENISFLKLMNDELVSEHLLNHSYVGFFISIMILLAAATKSAQFPFSSWLPRAMEGPTPSSAIFYGSLSVHLGAFLLLRTFPFWEHQIFVIGLIIAVGVITSILATLIARVQSSVKSQIAYASMAQIGIIFIEIALGFENLALIHFAGNAFLRTYQLLVSPSVVTYLIREQFYNFVPRSFTFEDSWPKKIENTIYMISLKEWNLDSFMTFILWEPFKKLGKKLNFLNVKILIYLFVPSYVLGLVLLYFNVDNTDLSHQFLPNIFSIIGLLLVLKSFSERNNPVLAWMLIIINHFWMTLAICFNEHFTANEVIFYLSGIVISGYVGYFCLNRLSLKEQFDLNQFYGHIYEHPRMALVFLLSSLGLMAFPITPTFIGIDLIFSHIHSNQLILAITSTLSFVLAGIALIRMYCRIFLGPHIKTYHSTPFKSS